MIRTILAMEAIVPGVLLDAFVAAIGPGHGAVTSFVGLVRGSEAGGERVDSLFLDHHPRLSEASLRTIAEQASERFAVGAIEIVHRAGTVVTGDPIVWVAAAAAHRRAAFDAVDYVMDRLKTEAVLWKREDGARSAWIEPTDADHAARNRWHEEA